MIITISIGAVVLTLACYRYYTSVLIPEVRAPERLSTSKDVDSIAGSIGSVYVTGPESSDVIARIAEVNRAAEVHQMLIEGPIYPTSPLGEATFELLVLKYINTKEIFFNSVDDLNPSHIAILDKHPTLEGIYFVDCRGMNRGIRLLLPKIRHVVVE